MNIVLILFSVVLGTDPFIHVDPEDRVIRDNMGRHVILHGVNVVYKVPPYIPDDSHFSP